MKYLRIVLSFVLLSYAFMLNGCGGGSGAGTGATNQTPPTPSGAAPAITAFSVNGSTGVITGDRIAITVPYGTNVTSLTATFTAPGSIVSVNGIPQISGVTTNNFTQSLVYTITQISGTTSASAKANASSSTTRTYTVTVMVASISAKAITAFSLGTSSSITVARGIISILNIEITVPFGTNLTSLVATFTTSGQSVTVNGVTQINGVTANDFTHPVIYRVTAADGTTQNYIVTVTVASDSSNDMLAFSLNGTPGVISQGGLAKSIVVKVPYGTNLNGLVATFITTGTSVVINGVNQVSGVTQNDFTNPVTYIVTAANGTIQTYTVSIIVSTISSNFINDFSFGNITGVISGQNIAVTVPSGTNVTDLIASFTTTGESVKVGTAIQTSTQTPNDFTNPVTYTVVAADGTTLDYTVTVIVANSSSKAITAFAFGLVSGVITGQNIAVTMPFGTDVTNLIASFTTTGERVFVGTTTQSSGSTVNDFTNPVSYVVTAADGSTATYVVIVTVAPSSAKAITAFSVAGSAGVITGTNIAVTVPFGTSLTTVANFTATGASVTVNGVTQVPNLTTVNFTTPATYVVTAADGSTQNYVVTVTVAPSTAKAITSFTLANVSGIITGTNISVAVPNGTDVTSLIATFTTTGTSVFVGATQQISGSVSAQNFSTPVSYVVNAADGSSTTYTVTVTISLPSLVWTKQVGGSGGNTLGRGINVDNSDNSYIAGSTSVGLSGQTQTGSLDYFVAKYNTSGTLLWSRQVGASGGSTSGYGVGTDSSNNSYVTGYTNVAISGQTKIGINDYFIAKYDTSGTLLWSRQVGASGGQTEGHAIRVDSGGNSYIAGYTNVAISGQAKIGTADYFLAKYDTSGTLLWTRQVGASGGVSQAYGVTVDSSGNSYVVGYTNVGLSGQTQNGLVDYFIAKYDTSGTLLWARQVGSNPASGDTEAYGVSVDTSGNSYVTGPTNVAISGQTKIGNNDYFIAKYNSSGTLLWTKQVGASSGDTQGLGISVVSSNGNNYVTGRTSRGISGQTQTGFVDYFVALYDTSGALLWTTQVGASSGTTIGFGVSVGSSGNGYVTGQTTRGISGQTQSGTADYFVAKY